MKQILKYFSAFLVAIACPYAVFDVSEVRIKHLEIIAKTRFY